MKQAIFWSFGLWIPGILGISACKRQSPSCVLHVAAASSLVAVLPPIHRRFQQETGCQILLDTGSSGILRRKIERGAPHSVFLSASAWQMGQLQRRAYLVPETLRTFASNQLVLIGARQTRRPPQDLPSLRRWLVAPTHRIAIGDPGHVPAGRYAQQALKTWRLWDVLAPRLIRTQHVRAALHTVRQGHLQAAIVFASDAFAAGHQVVVWHRFDRQLHPTIQYQAAVLRKSAQQRAARRYIDLLASTFGQQHLRRHGFLLPRVAPTTTPATSRKP